ncbi:MAG: alpha/beta fold hydrolase [Balneolaceae bacterium]|nr:MAG: alpha/beta fold hydrolase [Balneolaceae bacterium]
MRIFSDSINYHCTLHQADKRLPVLLMLHGFMGSARVFKPLIEKLSFFCNPLTIDLAGHENTQTPPDAALFSAERQSAQLHSVLGRLQLERLYLYGYSMGGRLAFQLMARYPNHFSGAIIESAHCGITDESERKNRVKADYERIRIIESDFELFIENWKKHELFDNTPAEMEKLYSSVMASQKPDLMAASLRGFGAGVMPHVCDHLKESGIRLKLISGSLDETYVKRMQEIQSVNPLITLDIVEDAGHRVHAGKPAEWLRIVREFLADA